MGINSFCCKLTENKGEDELRNIILSIGVNSISEIQFRRELKELSKDDYIQINDFLIYMQKYWSKNKQIKDIQISIFNKYFTATMTKDVSIYELILLLLPVFNIKLEEKKKTFIDIINKLSYPKRLFKNVKEIINLYYNFHTIFVTKVIYYELKNCSNSNNYYKETSDLKDILMNAFTEELVNKEVSNLISFIEKKDKQVEYLNTQDIENISNNISFDLKELRDRFVNKYTPF